MLKDDKNVGFSYSKRYYSNNNKNMEKKQKKYNQTRLHVFIKSGISQMIAKFIDFII